MTELTDKSNSRAGRVMEGKPNLLFRSSDKVYAIDVAAVKEIVLLPALKPLAEKSTALVGLINVRGLVVPVLDLELRLGRSLKEYSLENKLLLLQYGERLLAVVVDRVMGVERIAASQIQSDMNDSQRANAIVLGIAKVRDEIVMMVNVEHLFSNVSESAAGSDQDNVADLDLSRQVFERFSAEDREELENRAASLMQTIGGESAEMKSMAVAELGQELFAFEFDFVREFFDARQVTPVPCCPRHIIGNINLRGNILTLIDIRAALNLPGVPPGIGGKVVVVKIDELEAGVLVDALHDVVNVRTAEIIPPGVAHVDSPIKGTARFGEKTMSILDLPKLLPLETWQVDEAIKCILIKPPG